MSPPWRRGGHRGGSVLATALAVVTGCPTILRAAAPVLEFLYPAGGQQGTTVTVTAGGALDPWPVGAWSDSPGVHVEAVAAEKGKFTIRIDKDVQAGPHLVRLYNAEGASAPRVFVVGDRLESVEAKPNNEVAQAEPAGALPATVNGRLEARGDVDSVAVRLDAGQTLVASVQGRRLGGPIDPLLHLHDAAGNPLAFAHDGLGLDPLLVHRAEQAGTYVVRVSAFAHPPAADVSLTGGENAVYRLSLTTGPFVRYAYPAGVTRGTKTAVQLFGWNLGPDGRPQTQEIDAMGTRPDQDHVLIPVPGGEGPLRVELNDGPELTEADPASSPPQQAPAPLAAPAAVNGRIAQPGEEDVLRFAAKKDERLIFAVRAGTAGAPADAVLRLEDDAGKPLAQDDDAAGGADPRLEWVAPADGVYRAVVADLNRRGGPDFVYRLSIRRPAPSVAATVDAHEYRLAPGATAAVKLAVARANGHAGGLVAVATDLPPGVTCAAVPVPDAGGEVVLTLAAAADAKPAGAPVRVVLRGTDPNPPTEVAATFDPGRDGGQELIRQAEAVWLTVLPKTEAGQ